LIEEQEAIFWSFEISAGELMEMVKLSEWRCFSLSVIDRSRTPDIIHGASVGGDQRAE